MSNDDRASACGTGLPMNGAGQAVSAVPVGIPDAWQPIATAPKDYSDVLVFSPENEDDNNRGVSIGWFDVEDKAWHSHDIQHPIGIQPTHWMPLPGAPAIGMEAGTGETRSGSTRRATARAAGIGKKQSETPA